MRAVTDGRTDGRTDGQTDGQTEGRYQVHYLPRFAVDNENEIVVYDLKFVGSLEFKLVAPMPDTTRNVELPESSVAPTDKKYV